MNQSSCRRTPHNHDANVFVNIYTIILLKSVGVRKLQVAIIARLSREMSLTVRIVWQYILSPVRVSIRPSIFLYAKNIQNYCEYRVSHASGQLNRTSEAGNCGHGSTPPTRRSGNELSCDNILWSRLIASGPSERRQHERRQHERRQLRSKRRQREFIPSRLESVVKELVRSLWMCSVCSNQQCRIVL